MFFKNQVAIFLEILKDIFRRKKKNCNCYHKRKGIILDGKIIIKVSISPFEIVANDNLKEVYLKMVKNEIMRISLSNLNEYLF